MSTLYHDTFESEPSRYSILLERRFLRLGKTGRRRIKKNKGFFIVFREQASINMQEIVLTVKYKGNFRGKITPCRSSLSLACLAGVESVISTAVIGV